MKSSYGRYMSQLHLKWNIGIQHDASISSTAIAITMQWFWYFIFLFICKHVFKYHAFCKLLCKLFCKLFSWMWSYFLFKHSIKLFWNDKETERRLYQTIEIYDWSNDITDKFSLKWWRFTYQYSICYYVTDHFH